MTTEQLVNVVLQSWQLTAKAVAASPSEFLGRDKETRVFRRLRKEIATVSTEVGVIGPDSQRRVDRWRIDVVCADGHCQVPVEGKYKIASDGAIPDNRKAAFFDLDLFKLERYLDSGEYVGGFFLWLTNEPAYQQQASGDSVDFSTHGSGQQKISLCVSAIPLRRRTHPCRQARPAAACRKVRTSHAPEDRLPDSSRRFCSCRKHARIGRR